MAWSGMTLDRTPQARRRHVSRAAIMNAAEELFAAHGRDGVTVKAIALKAGLDPALVRYYFGDRDAVFIEMFERRAGVLNEERNAAMDRYEAECDGQYTIRGVLTVFLRPMFDAGFNRGKGWRNFAEIAAVVNASRAGHASIMSEHFDAIVGRFIGYLRLLAPDVPEAALFWFFNHLTGALTYAAAQTGRIDHLSGGIVRSDQMELALSTMVSIFEAGFEALRKAAVKS